MSEKKPWIVAGIGLLAVVAIVIGLRVFNSSDSEADEAASPETTAVEDIEHPEPAARELPPEYVTDTAAALE
ncbi:hypothetical protein J2S70_000352 [Trueperella bonasi]|uniref:Uncharacterized protein n=1 Tax=Trueperella bonasi TaxID=312286 RepID=A0ABT9NEY8_9ACTO|nr:hypothetical protein [Trueperella bonasi]MDP9805770.1 hypothetical protein [Trueperella bonasi]